MTAKTTKAPAAPPAPSHPAEFCAEGWCLVHPITEADGSVRCWDGVHRHHVGVMTTHEHDATLIEVGVATYPEEKHGPHKKNSGGVHVLVRRTECPEAPFQLQLNPAEARALAERLRWAAFSMDGCDAPLRAGGAA